MHGVLQFADLEHGTDIDRLAEAQCAAEGILGVSSHGRRPRPLGAGGADRPRRTREHEHHRELFVAAEIDGRVLEGYIDLLVRTPDGLRHRRLQDRPVDRHRRRRDERIARYRRQLAAYGVAIERVLGEPVVGGVLVRCRVGEAAEEIPIDDWRGAVEALAGAVRQRE